MCCFLVSGFFTEVTQQIHSLRASGVIFSQVDCAFGEEISASLRSLGILCTGGLEMFFCIHEVYQKSFTRSEGFIIRYEQGL